MQFIHSGDMGDIIYFLPAVKYLHNKDVPTQIYIKPERFTRQVLDLKAVQPLMPLLAAQPYIDSIEMWNGEDGIDCNKWRETYQPTENLIQKQLSFLNVPLDCAADPWLCVQPKRVAKQVINRSFRYHCHFPIEFVEKDAIFIGTKREHTAWQAEFDRDIEYYPTKDLLQAAEVIAGSELFIGNQSCCYAIVEALKHNSILEVFLPSPNCISGRRNAQFVMGWTEKEYQIVKFDERAGGTDGTP